MLAALLYCRQREITDMLVDLLITTVHRINARAETRVVNESYELKRVAGKENLISFKMTEAALGGPDRLVSEVIYPAVPGGAETLAALLQEYRTQGTGDRQHKQRVFKASCTGHYRRGLIELIEALEFGSTNTAHAPVIEALGLIKRYKAEHTPHTQYYRRGEDIPVARVVPAELMYQPCAEPSADRTRFPAPRNPRLEQDVQGSLLEARGTIELHRS